MLTIVYFGDPSPTNVSPDAQSIPNKAHMSPAVACDTSYTHNN